MQGTHSFRTLTTIRAKVELSDVVPLESGGMVGSQFLMDKLGRDGLERETGF
jgi:hypothetical protein